MPPVAKTSTPAEAAIMQVAATVVAPMRPCAMTPTSLAGAGDVFGGQQALQLGLRQADADLSVDHRDGRGLAPAAHLGLHRLRKRPTLRRREPVTQDGRLQRHHSLTSQQRVRHLW